MLLLLYMVSLNLRQLGLFLIIKWTIDFEKFIIDQNKTLIVSFDTVFFFYLLHFALSN